MLWRKSTKGHDTSHIHVKPPTGPTKTQEVTTSLVHDSDAEHHTGFLWRLKQTVRSDPVHIKPKGPFPTPDANGSLPQRVSHPSHQPPKLLPAMTPETGVNGAGEASLWRRRSVRRNGQTVSATSGSRLSIDTDKLHGNGISIDTTVTKPLANSTISEDRPTMEEPLLGRKRSLLRRIVSPLCKEELAAKGDGSVKTDKLDNTEPMSPIPSDGSSSNTDTTASTKSSNKRRVRFEEASKPIPLAFPEARSTPRQRDTSLVSMLKRRVSVGSRSKPKDITKSFPTAPIGAASPPPWALLPPSPRRALSDSYFPAYHPLSAASNTAGPTGSSHYFPPYQRLNAGPPTMHTFAQPCAYPHPTSEAVTRLHSAYHGRPVSNYYPALPLPTADQRKEWRSPEWGARNLSGVTAASEKLPVSGPGGVSAGGSGGGSGAGGGKKKDGGSEAGSGAPGEASTATG